MYCGRKVFEKSYFLCNFIILNANFGLMLYMQFTSNNNNNDDKLSEYLMKIIRNTKYTNLCV